MIFIHRVYGITEDFTVVAIEQGQFLTTITTATDDEGLIQHTSGAEIVRKEL